MHGLDGTNQLKHEIPNVLGFQRTFSKPDGFVEIAIRAEFQDKVDVVGGFERLKKINNVGVRPNAEMNCQFFRVLIHGKARGTGVGGTRLREALYGNVLAGDEIPGLEDHAERAMVERSDGFISSIENIPLLELIAHALHVDDLKRGNREAKRVSRKESRVAERGVYKKTKTNKTKKTL